MGLFWVLNVSTSAVHCPLVNYPKLTALLQCTACFYDLVSYSFQYLDSRGLIKVCYVGGAIIE